MPSLVQGQFTVVTRDMKCSMVKDKDRASSSPIPMHCGESSKSWTKASKNCENKSKRLKSTKASRDQHSCANRGAAEHCISVPRVFATVSSSDRVYQRAFSLKRHYLRSHINYRHLTERDISNCGIVVGDKMAVQSGTNTKIYMQNSKIISVGSTLSQETLNCSHIVEEQCTTSDGIKTETVSNDNGILIIPCVSNGTVKLQGESTYSCEPIQDSKSESMHANISLENSSFKEVIGTTTSDIPIHFPGLYRCHTCGICFDEKDDLKSHLSNHPPTVTNVVIGENNTYACNQCNATFTHKHNYLRHCASAVHNKSPVAATEETQERCLIKVHLCLYCDKGFKSAAIRKRHQGRMHKKQKGPGKRKYHACPYCSKSQKKFKDFSLLMEHMVSSHPDKYHGCVMCAIRFDSKESFNKHLETSHMKTKLKIPKPDIAESNKSTLVVDVSQTTNSDVTVNSLPVIQRVNLKETSQSSTNMLNESSVAAEKETINENEDSINKPADLLNSVGDEFRYTCGVCQKMFTNYVNMCRHRRLAHGTVTAKTKKAKQGPKDFETASVCSSASSQNNGSSRSQSPAVVKTLTGSPAKVKAPARPQLTQQFQTVEISEKLLDPETLFYSKVASNIRENLLHHLDGKLECSDNVNKEKEPERSIAIDRPKRGEKILLKLDLVSSVALNGAPHNRMSLLAQSISSEVSKVSGRRDGLVHKVSWEKYNFPKNYDGRGDGLASYIKDMSHLDISTQLVMRQNLQRLNSEPTSPNTKDEIDNSDFDFPRGLCLMKNDVAKTESISTPSSPKPELSRTNSSPSVPSCMDVKDKSIIELDCPKSSGARRKSLSDLKVPALSSGSMQRDFPPDSALGSAVELSGEWVRPRKYICGACGERFRDLYILEDHKYSVHPNVWCTHLEFEESTIAGMSFDDKSNSQLPFPGSLCRRFLNPTGALTSAIVVPPTKASESSCTKCSKVLNSLSDLHRHMLECGGDNTWMLTMVAASPSGGRRNRKWRPFGSRRRRQQGRRGMKRNIPSSPMKLPPYRARHRATDIDSIQRMISNLPAKRATRRVIQFSEDDIKTRSQATIHSVTFAPSLPRTHHKHTIGRHRLKSSANEALKFEVKKKKSAISRVLSAASAKKHSKPLSDLPLTEPAGLVVEKSSTFSDDGLVNNISVEQTLKQVPQTEDTDTSEAASKSKEKWQSSRNVLSKKRLSVMKGKLPKTLLLDKEDKSQEHIPTKSSATNAYTSSAVSEEKPTEKIGKGRGKKVVVSTKIMRKSLVSAKLRNKKSSVIPSKTHSLEAKDLSATHNILMTIVPRRSGRTASLTRDKDSAAEDKTTVSSPVVDTELHLLPVPFQSASCAQEDEIKPISNASTSVAKESSNILETICAVPHKENHSEDKAKRDLTSDIDNSRKIKLVGPGKGKKIEIGNTNKKTKLKKKIEPEEKKIKGDEQISETNICEGCGLQFDNNSAYGRHMKTCIYVKKSENMSQPSIDATNIVSHQCNKCWEVFNLHTSLVEHSKVCTLASKESEVVKRKPGRPPKIKCIQNDDLNLLTTEEIKNPVHNNSDIKMPELQKEEPVVSVKRVGRPKKIKESSDEIPVLSPASKMETPTQTNFTNNEILSKVKNKVVKRNHTKEAPRSIIKEDKPLTELLTTVKETIFDSLDEIKTENNDVIDYQELKHTRRSKHKKYLTKTNMQSVPLIIGKKHTSEEETINVDKTTPPPSLAEDDLETTKISLESTPDLQDTSCFESLSSKDDETLSKPKPNVTKKSKVDSKDDINSNKGLSKENLFAGKVVNKMASQRTSDNDQSSPKICLYDSVKELENNTNMSDSSISNSVDHFSKTIEAVVAGAGGSVGKNVFEKSNITSETKQNEQTTLQSDTVTNTNNTLQVGAQIKVSKIVSFCDEVPKDFSKSGLHNGKHVKNVHKKGNIDLVVSDVSLHHTSNTSRKDKDVAERTALKIEEDLSSSNSWIDIDEDTLPISKLKEISVARKFGLMKVEPKLLRGRGRGRWRGRGRGRGRGFKKTSEVNGGTNYPNKSLTEVDIVQELSRETPSIDIELQNLDEDSSKDTALSYDEESKLSEQVLHMGDHFSLGGNRLLRARRDQGGFRKDTASRFGRRESRARSTRCNLSYEEMYTSSDVAKQTESGLSSHVSSTIPDDIPEVENIIGDSISDTCFDQDPSFQKNWFYYDNCDTIENEMLCGFKKPTKDTMIETAQLSTFGSDPNTLLKEDSIKVNTSNSHQKLCAVQQSEDLCNSESLPQANQIQDILLHSLALAEQIPLQENIQLNLSPSKEPEIQNCLSTDFDKEMSCTQDAQLVQSPELQVTEMDTCLSLAIENQSSLVLTAKIESPSSEKCKIQDCFSNELDEHQSLLQASYLQDHSSKQPGIQEFVSLEFEKEHETLSLDKDKSSNYSDKEVLISEDIPAKASSLHLEEKHTPLPEEPITITFAPKESHSSHSSDTVTLLSANLAVQASSQQSKVFIHSQQENIIQKPAAIELPLHLPPGLDPEVEALLSLGSEIQDRSNFWTNSEQVRSYNLPETQAHSNLSTAKPQICGIQDSCPILRKGNFTTETTINHDTVASQPSNQPQVVRISAEPPSGVESVVDEPPKIFDAPDTKVIEIASKNSTEQKSYGGIDNRAGMTEPPEPVAVFSGTEHAVSILPDQPCWPDDASWQGTNIGWVPTNEVETSAEWTYGGAEWVPPETGPGAPDIQWIQQEGTQFGIDQLQPISSLGSILDSVNQILNTGAGTSGEQVLLNEYGGFSSTLAAGSVMTGELVDLQRAMGATDEEMLMLQKLGEDGWPLENADLMDLDNQRSRAEGGVKEQEEEQEGEETSSPLPAKTSPKKTNQVSSIMMRRQRTEDRPFGHCQNILSQYEQKEMVCPLCNKHFLGLAALQTHVASTHNVREGPDKKMKTYERSRKAMIASIATTTLGQVINHRHMCVWCKELHVDEESLQRHVESTHSSEGIGVKDEGLKSHMSTALGGLLNRALGHVFHTVQNTSILKELSLSNRKQPSEEGGSSRPQTPINSVKEEVVDEAGNKSKEPLRRKSQEEDKDKPYSCHMCDVKFLVLSSRNRHIARVHGLGPKPPPEEGVLSDQSEPDFEKNCGINFQTPQEVLKHRQLEHNHEPSPEPKETDKCSVTKETSSNADIVGTHEDNEPTSTALPVKTLDVLSEPFFVNVQGNISECSRDTVSPGSLENNSGNKEEPLLPSLQLRTLPSSQLLTMDNHPQQLHPPRAQTPPHTTPQPLLIEKIKCPVTNDRPANKTSSRSIESTSRKLARSKMNVEELERQLCKNDAMIKAKAEAAIRELSLSRKGRSSASSNKWGVHRYKFTVPDRQPGVEGDNKLVPAPEDRYSYPLIRKVSNSRFASLTERMKKQCGKVNPCVAESSPEKEVLDITSSNTGSAAFAVYEFDEEESEPVTELSLRGNGGTSIIKGLPHQTGNERIKDKENDEEVIVDQETVLWSHENSRTLHGKGALKRLFKDGLETDRDKEVVIAKKPRKISECQVSPNKSPGSTGLREYNLDVFEDRGVKRKNTFEELTPRNIIVEKQKSERFENISQTFDAISAVPNFEKESFCSSIEKLGVANLSASPEVNLPFISSKLSSHSNVETTKTILNKAHKKTEIGGGVVKGRHKDKGLSSDQVFDEILKNTVNDKKVKDKPKKQIKLVNLKGIEESRSKQSYAGEQTRSETSTKKFNTVLDQDLKNKKKDQKNKLAVHSNRPSHKSNNTQNLETLKKGNKRDQEMLTSQENEELKKSRRQVKRVSYAETLDSELEEDLFEDSIVIEDTDTKLKQKLKSSKKRISMDEKNKRKSDKEFSTEPNTKISTIAALKRSKQKLNYSDDKSEDDSSIDNFDQHKFLASNAKISQKKDKAYSNRFFDNDSVTEDDDTSESDATDKTKKPQQRNTKTDLLKCVFAKSRRNSTTIVSGSGGCVPDMVGGAGVAVTVKVLKSFNKTQGNMSQFRRWGTGTSTDHKV
uniref:C2H2-type domain-containing protein n=1 Tax=Timema tahoe TaxID=61484 RepID=A0A7R9NVD0_9NEOP|nr:unnamed protein product [Timema tahoe]